METQTSGTSSTVTVLNSSHDVNRKLFNVLIALLSIGMGLNFYIIVSSVFSTQKTQYEFKLWSKDMDIKEMKTDVKEYLRRQGSLVNPSTETKLLMNKLGIN